MADFFIRYSFDGNSLSPTEAVGATGGELSPNTLGDFSTNASDTSTYPSRPVLYCRQSASTTTSAQSAVNRGKGYFSLEFAPEIDDGLWQPTTLTLKAARGGSGGVRGFCVTSSASNFSAVLDQRTGNNLPIRPELGTYTLDLSAAGPQTGPLTIRVVIITDNFTRSVEFDDIVVNGVTLSQDESGSGDVSGDSSVTGLASVKTIGSATGSGSGAAAGEGDAIIAPYSLGELAPVYSNNFSSGSFTGWASANPGQVSVSGGRLQGPVSGNAYTAILQASTFNNDHAIRARLFRSPEGGAAALTVRQRQGVADPYVGASVVMLPGAGSPTSVSVREFTSAGAAALGTVPVAGDGSMVTVVALGSTLYVQADNDPAVAFPLSDAGSELTRYASITFGSASPRWSMDDLAVLNARPAGATAVSTTGSGAASGGGSATGTGAPGRPLVGTGSATGGGTATGAGVVARADEGSLSGSGTAETYVYPAPKALTVVNGQFRIDGAPGRLAMANFYDAVITDNSPTSPDGSARTMPRSAITSTLEDLKATGHNSVRAHTLFINQDKPGTAHPDPGVWDESVLVAADWFLAEAQRLGLLVMGPAGDRWAFYHGGFASYAQRRGLGGLSNFLANDRIPAGSPGAGTPIQNDWFDNHYDVLVNRRNTFTGLPWRQMIHIFESGNEVYDAAFQAFHLRLARYVKALPGGSRIVADGSAASGNYPRDWALSDPNTDVVGSHFYNDKRMDLDEVRSQARTAAGSGKAYVVGEYDWRNNRQPGAGDDVQNSAVQRTAWLARLSEEVQGAAWWPATSAASAGHEDGYQLRLDAPANPEQAAMRAEIRSWNPGFATSQATRPEIPYPVGGYSDTFDGQGPLDHAKHIVATTDGSTINREADSAVMRLGTSGGYADKATLASRAPAVNDLVWSFSVTPSSSAEAYFRANFRTKSSGDATDYTSRYTLEITSGGSMSLVYRGVGSDEIMLQSRQVPGFRIDEKVNVETIFRPNGFLQVKVWTGPDKPLDATFKGSSSKITTPGFVGVTLNGGDVGAPARVWRVDDWSLSSNEFPTAIADSAALTGSGTPSAIAQIKVADLTGLSGAGTVSALALPVAQQAGQLSGSGDAAGAGYPSQNSEGSGELSGSGALRAAGFTGSPSLAADAAADGSGTVTGDGGFSEIPVGRVSGSGTAEGSSSATTAGSGAADGTGTASGDGLKRPADAGTASGNGSIQGAGVARLSATGPASGSGTAAQSTTELSVAASGDASGNGALDSNAAGGVADGSSVSGSGTAAGELIYVTTADAGTAGGNGLAVGAGSGRAISTGGATGDGDASGKGSALAPGEGGATGSGDAAGSISAATADSAAAGGSGESSGLGAARPAGLGATAGSGAVTGRADFLVLVADGELTGIGSTGAGGVVGGDGENESMGTATGVGSASTQAVGAASGAGEALGFPSAVIDRAVAATGAGTAVGTGSGRSTTEADLTGSGDLDADGKVSPLSAGALDSDGTARGSGAVGNGGDGQARSEGAVAARADYVKTSDFRDAAGSGTATGAGAPTFAGATDDSDGSGELAGSGKSRALVDGEATGEGNLGVVTLRIYLDSGLLYSEGSAIGVGTTLKSLVGALNGEGSAVGFGVQGGTVISRSRDYELRIQRINTVAYIASDPTSVVISREVTVGDGAGGWRVGAVAPIAPQEMRIVSTALASLGAERTVDGQHIDARPQLLARWDADIQLNDEFRAEDSLYRVTEVLRDRGYETVVNLEMVT